jgi:hypothetical protein
VVEVGSPNRGNYGAYVYQYDSNGNILDQIYLYTSTLTVGETFIRNAYLKDDTVSIRPSSTSSGSSDTTNEDSSSSNNNTGSVAENIETLKQYINTNGVTNQAGNKMLNYKNGSQTTAISYVAQTGELQFISSSGNSGMTIVMDSASNMSTLQADYVMYSGGVGFIATGYIEPSTYTSSQTIAFTLGTTNAGEKLTEADIQDLCNAELKVGFYGWQIILYKYLKMELKDIGFTSYQ